MMKIKKYKFVYEDANPNDTEYVRIREYIHNGSKSYSLHFYKFTVYAVNKFDIPFIEECLVNHALVDVIEEKVIFGNAIHKSAKILEWEKKDIPESILKDMEDNRDVIRNPTFTPAFVFDNGVTVFCYTTTCHELRHYEHIRDRSAQWVFYTFKDGNVIRHVPCRFKTLREFQQKLLDIVEDHEKTTSFIKEKYCPNSSKFFYEYKKSLFSELITIVEERNVIRKTREINRNEYFDIAKQIETALNERYGTDWVCKHIEWDSNECVFKIIKGEFSLVYELRFTSNYIKFGLGYGLFWNLSEAFDGNFYDVDTLMKHIFKRIDEVTKS